MFSSSFVRPTLLSRPHVSSFTSTLLYFSLIFSTSFNHADLVDISPSCCGYCHTAAAGPPPTNAPQQSALQKYDHGLQTCSSIPANTRPVRRSLPVLNKRANKLITVIVGGTQDTFVPNSVQAAVGDVIQFQFSSGNHTVTQSSADAPCTPLQLSDPTAIHSGHVPYEAGQTTVGTFNMPVTSTDPTFFYCATGPHCQNGQIMVLNPYEPFFLAIYLRMLTAAKAQAMSRF